MNRQIATKAFGSANTILSLFKLPEIKFLRILYMADILGELDQVITICKEIYAVYEEYKDLDGHYSSLFDDVVIVEALISSLQHHGTLPRAINTCIRTITSDLRTILRKINKYRNEGCFKKIIHIKTRQVYKIEESLKEQIKKVELLVKLKTIKDNNEKTNVYSILSPYPKVLEFWIKKVGADKISIQFNAFIELVELTFRALRTSEIGIFKVLFNCDNNRDTIHCERFLKWILRFGGNMHLATKKTLNCLCKPKTGEIFPWFHTDVFRQQAIEDLKEVGFGSRLVRFSNNNKSLFIVHLKGLDGEMCEFQLKSICSGEFEGLYQLLLPKKVQKEYCRDSLDIGTLSRNGSQSEAEQMEESRSTKDYNDSHEEKKKEGEEFVSKEKQKENQTEKLLYPMFIRRAFKCSINPLSNSVKVYYKNIYIFMWRMKISCKKLSEHTGTPYKPFDWKTKKTKEKYAEEDIVEFPEEEKTTFYVPEDYDSHNPSGYDVEIGSRRRPSYGTTYIVQPPQMYYQSASPESSMQMSLRQEEEHVQSSNNQVKYSRQASYSPGQYSPPTYYSRERYPYSYQQYSPPTSYSPDQYSRPTSYSREQYPTPEQTSYIDVPTSQRRYSVSFSPPPPPPLNVPIPRNNYYRNSYSGSINSRGRDNTFAPRKTQFALM